MRKYVRKYTEDRGKSLYDYKGCWGIPYVVWIIIIILGLLFILVLSGDFLQYKIAFSAYSQQKVNRRKNRLKTDMNTSKHRIYSQTFISDLHYEIMQQIRNCQTQDELNRIVQKNIRLITGSKSIDWAVYKRRCEIIQYEKQI